MKAKNTVMRIMTEAEHRASQLAQNTEGNFTQEDKDARNN